MQEEEKEKKGFLQVKQLVENSKVGSKQVVQLVVCSSRGLAQRSHNDSGLNKRLVQVVQLEA